VLNLPENFNASAYFVDRHVEEGRGAKVAIECGERRIAYSELSRNVNRAGNSFRKLGLRTEERIALLLNDSPEFAYCFFGAIKIGAVPVPLNTFLNPSDYELILKDCRARMLVVTEDLLPNIREIRIRLQHLEVIIVVGTTAASPFLNFDDLMMQHSPKLSAEDTKRDDAAFWLYSSGTTGQPKGCVHLQHDMVVATEQYAKATLGATADDKLFSVSKLFFAYGLGNGLYFPLGLGATSVLWPGSTHPANVIRVIEQHRPTLLFSVPSNYAALVEYSPKMTEKATFSSVRWGVSAGEKLPSVIYQRFKDYFGVEILDGIGSTEATHIFISNRPGAIRPGSTGQVVPGFGARILDDEERPMPDGEIGNLWIKSDATCERYWNQHDLTKKTIRGEWILTGDKFWQDRDGFFWYAGRADDMLKISGTWVSPSEIESVLAEHSDVAECVVVGVVDTDGLIKPHAYVVLRDLTRSSSEIRVALEDWVSGKLPRHKRPRAFHFVEGLPRTATGKVQRFVLRLTGEKPAPGNSGGS